MIPRWSELRRSLTKHRKKIVLVVMYSLVVAGSMWVEHGNELFGSSGCGFGLTVRFWHHWLSTAGYRKPHAHFVRIIAFTPGEQKVGDICAMREFVADLLPKLREAQPHSIVMDMWYPDGFCTNETNQKLINAFQTVSADVPIIVGRTADTTATLQANRKFDLLKKLQADGLEENEVVLGDDLLKSVSRLGYGIAFPNCDNRRIPLSWPFYVPSDQRVTQHHPSRYPTLAFAASEKYDSEIQDRLKYFVTNGVDPLTSFIPEQGFRPINALELCDAGEKWSACHLLDSWKDELRGRVLLVGEFSSRELRDSALGVVPGAVLQANYIESLLDDRYFWPLKEPVEFTLTIFCLVVIEVIFYHAEHRPLTGIALAVFFPLSLMALSYFAIMQFGLFLTFWIPALFAIIFRSIELFRVLVKRGTHSES